MTLLLSWKAKLFVATLAVLLGVTGAHVILRGLAPTIPEVEPFVIVRTECGFATVARECLEQYDPSVLVLPLDTGSPEVCRNARRRLAGGWLLDENRYCDALVALTRERALSIDAELPTPLFVRGSRAMEGLSTEGFELVGASACQKRWRAVLEAQDGG